MAGLLRLTSDIPAEQGLVAESLAYSMLVATGPGTWAARTAEGLVPVSPPRVRPPRSAAARLGQHTREVLAGR